MTESENSKIVLRPTGLSDAWTVIVPGATNAAILAFFLRDRPAAAIGAILGLLIFSAFLALVRWNPKTYIWWEVDADGVCYKSQPVWAKAAKTVTFLCWADVADFKIDAISPFLVKGISIRSKTGARLWVPRATDRYMHLADMLRDRCGQASKSPRDL